MSNETNKVIRISLSVFSGRPNPYWELSGEKIDELRNKIIGLPRTKEVQSPGLGYRGFKINNREKIKGIPERMYIYRKTISFREKTVIVFYEDSNNIEELLFQQAKEQGFEKLVEKIKAREENEAKSV